MPFLWIYPNIDGSAVVNNYSKLRVSYYELTQGMSFSMGQAGMPSMANIRHDPSNCNWQHNAIETLKKIGVKIPPKDVLTEVDYKRYRKLYGVS